MKRLLIILFPVYGIFWASVALGQIDVNSAVKVGTAQNESPQHTQSITITKKVLAGKDEETSIGAFKIGKDVIIFPRGFEVKHIADIDPIKQKLFKLKGGTDLPKEGATYRFTFKKQQKIFKQKVNEAELKTATIDSIKISIKEGIIEFLKVFCANGDVFYNRDAPISILNLQDRYGDKLFNPYNNDFILLKDALSFDSDIRFNFFPDDNKFTISKKANNSPYPLTGKTHVSNFVNLQAYSDLLATFGDKPNGILQLEANSKFYLHRTNLPNKFMYVVDAIEPFLHFNRIDSKFDTIALDASNEINRMELFRRYTYALGTNLSLFRVDWIPANSFSIKAGYIYSVSSITANQTNVDAALHTPYFELGLKNSKAENFSIDLLGRFLFQKLNPNQVIANTDWNNMLSFKAKISYFSKSNPKDKVFLRFTNYLDLSARKNDFSQLQFGVSKALSF